MIFFQLDQKGATRRWLLPLQRFAARWWRSQPPARQDRFATLGPLVSVLLFLAAIITAFWYLRNEDFERETEAVIRDTEIAQQQIRLRLNENQEQLLRLARELVTNTISAQNFSAEAASFARERPEITQIIWLSNQRKRRASITAAGFQADVPMNGNSSDPSMPMANQSSAPEVAFQAARARHQPSYSPPFGGAGNIVFQVHVPLLDHNGFTGVLIAEYSVEAMLRYFVPVDLAERHPMALVDTADRVISSTVTLMPGKTAKRASIWHELPMAPAMNGLVLRGQGYRSSIGLISNTLFWMVVALSTLTVWMLLGSWRHMRRRLQIQTELATEMNFRRAMENSMLTGMRAMDMASRITYVNPAFCAMTGFSEQELIGALPPFAFWPTERHDEYLRLQDLQSQGNIPAGGAELRILRKDGTLFDCRMYVSPLIDAKGLQSGWMTSMTNITEAKRVRDQLSASHERFTTMLEGLDASVSVLSVQQGGLLFANRSYRQWFGAFPAGHALLAGTQVGHESGPDADEEVDGYSGLPAHYLTDPVSDPREVYVDSLEMWFDVRARYLQWTDGTLAQMLIATDVTMRRRAEDLAARQAERAQASSRLMTMGEMASSVAHELNQPLTAITNYCNGMVSRVRGDQIGKDDLLAALEKTAKQAQRAGQIIHRIRNFVKRSEPRRESAQAAAIVEDAVELAGIELRRRHVAIHTYVAQRLPQLLVDPILIEQVLMNLLKNAAESIDNAALPVSRRHIELRVVPRHTPELGGHIEFSVTDMGPGMPEEVIARMYEAFFSTKADGMGIGLGLCRSIIESHQGRINAENLYNGAIIVGCRFAFTLPVEISRPDIASGAAVN
jgi:PAS domain S-box-containing protein